MNKTFCLILALAICGCAVTQQGPESGFGSSVTSGGTRYVGNFENGKANGKGTATTPNGDKYIGGFKDDVFHGKMEVIYANGDRFVGEYNNGRRTGQGRLTDIGKFDYEGEFRNSAHGKCKVTLPNGDVYTGFCDSDFYNTNDEFLSWMKTNLTLQTDIGTRKVKDDQKLSLITEAKSECKVIGFEPETEKYADCVLRILELNKGKVSTSVITQPTTSESDLEAKQRELLELQIKRQKNLERDRKYDQAIDVLKSIQNNLPN